jgi:PTS system nitrogen regulatory IIA component
VGQLVGAFAKSEDGIEYSSQDNQPVKLVFMLLASENSTGQHLKALARISRLLRSREFRDDIEDAKTAGEIYRAISEADGKLD